MNNTQRFSYDSLTDLQRDAGEHDLFLPVTQDIKALGASETIGTREVPNSLCVNPMEGHDADSDGGPSVLTFRRYRRYATGGSGVIWVEATAVSKSGKAHPRQLHINEESIHGFSQLVEEIKRFAKDHNGNNQRPLVVLQLTHSGRQSAPHGVPAPLIAKHSELLGDNSTIASEYPVLTDAQLDALADDYVKAAFLGAKAGFDAIDVKACHGYLLHELLFSYENQTSKYRGPFKNRISFLLDVSRRIKEKLPEVLLASRLSLYDNIPYPDGWGVAKDGGINPDLTEPIKLLGLLVEIGLDILNVAFGNPYYDPFLERPYDQPLAGENLPDRHPLIEISTNLRITAEISKEFPNLFTVGGGISWLRDFFPNVATAMKQEGIINAIGLGRIALSYPNYANELLKSGKLKRNKLCVSCSCCSQMMVDGVEVGCLVYDDKIYKSSYLKGRRGAR